MEMPSHWASLIATSNLSVSLAAASRENETTATEIQELCAIWIVLLDSVYLKKLLSASCL